jgi:F-type H+-transporting ATPase subunit epsilon
MADSFQLEIVTPDKLVVDARATEAQIPARKGYIGVLPEHAPLITELAVGVITYKNVKGETHHISVAWGFAEVLPDKVTILAETAERASDIDIERARQARAKAEAAVQQASTEAEVDSALDAAQRAEARIEVAQSSPTSRA